MHYNVQRIWEVQNEDKEMFQRLTWLISIQVFNIGKPITNPIPGPNAAAA